MAAAASARAIMTKVLRTSDLSARRLPPILDCTRWPGEPASAARLTAVEDKPWGMREFAVVDPNGNLLRVGRPL